MYTNPQVVYHYARVLAAAARAEAFTARALALDDRTAYDLAARGAAAKRDDVRKEMSLLRVRGGGRGGRQRWGGERQGVGLQGLPL
jgi:hypothetical protein